MSHNSTDQVRYFIYPQEAITIYGRVTKDEGGAHLYGEWYSNACPEGEWGTNPKKPCHEITEDIFLLAEVNGWPEMARAIMVLTREDLRVVLDAYDEAVQKGLEEFAFMLDGELGLMVTDFARYIISDLQQMAQRRSTIVN